MSELEQVQQSVQKLPPAEFKKFRAWFAEMDARLWDEQIEADSRAGKLDALISEAIAEHKAGKTREI